MNASPTHPTSYRLKNPNLLDSFDPSLITEDMTSDDLHPFEVKSFVNDRTAMESKLESLNIHCEEVIEGAEWLSLKLLDENERLKVSSAERFVERLKIRPSVKKVKVVSIFGNTGEGKSYTLNQTFFGGAEVFKTSPEQLSCTLGEHFCHVLITIPFIARLE